VLNCSAPFSGTVDFSEFDKHWHSNPKLPDAVPCVTSYYVRRWGLCLAHSKRERLDKSKKYRVEIKTKIFDGFLRYGDCVLEGQSEETILLSSYLCHPSLANNELSGPLALVALYKKLSKLKNRYFTYRFSINPETIGAITFLAEQKNRISKTFVPEWSLLASGVLLAKFRLSKVASTG